MRKLMATGATELILELNAMGFLAFMRLGTNTLVHAFSGPGQLQEGALRERLNHFALERHQV